MGKFGATVLVSLNIVQYIILHILPSGATVSRWLLLGCSWSKTGFGLLASALILSGIRK